MVQTLRTLRGASLRTAAMTSKRTALPTRRYASSGHDQHHSPEVNESLGIAFWIAAGAIPVCMAAYAFSRGKDGDDKDSKPALTRLIEWYEDDLRAKWRNGNDIRTQYIDKAREDANLFANTKRSDFVDLKFPEVFNTGSPHNVSPGSYVKLDKVVEHYKKLQEETRQEIARKQQ